MSDKDDHLRSEIKLRQSYQKRYFELYNLIKLWHEQRGHAASRGNSPNHGHSVPGVWDSDNGDIANTECAECQLWNKVKT